MGNDPISLNLSKKLFAKFIICPISASHVASDHPVIDQEIYF